jgi:hypothetical protein
MSDAHISGKLTTEEKEKVLNSLDDVMALLPFLGLSADDRIKLRKIGPDRLDFINEVNIASNTYGFALPTGFKLADFNEALALYRALSVVDTKLTPFKNALDNMLLLLGAELMMKSYEAYGYLKIVAERTDDQKLKSIIMKIINMLRFGKRRNNPDAGS